MTFVAMREVGLTLDLPALHFLGDTSDRAMFDVTMCCNGPEGSLMTMVCNRLDHSLQSSAFFSCSGLWESTNSLEPQDPPNEIGTVNDV
jgi:hypothetical protein